MFFDHTLEGTATMQYSIDLCVDGLITDHPDRLRAVPEDNDPQPSRAYPAR